MSTHNFPAVKALFTLMYTELQIDRVPQQIRFTQPDWFPWLFKMQPNKLADFQKYFYSNVKLRRFLIVLIKTILISVIFLRLQPLSQPFSGTPANLTCFNNLTWWFLFNRNFPFLLLCRFNIMRFKLTVLANYTLYL